MMASMEVDVRGFLEQFIPRALKLVLGVVVVLVIVGVISNLCSWATEEGDPLPPGQLSSVEQKYIENMVEGVVYLSIEYEIEID